MWKKSRQTLYTTLMGVSSTSLKDELRIKPESGLLRFLTFTVPIVIVIILVVGAIVLLIARGSRK